MLRKSLYIFWVADLESCRSFCLLDSTFSFDNGCLSVETSRRRGTNFSTRITKFIMFRRFITIRVILLANLWSRVMLVAMSRFNILYVNQEYRCHSITIEFSIYIFFEKFKRNYKLFKSWIMIHFLFVGQTFYFNRESLNEKTNMFSLTYFSIKFSPALICKVFNTASIYRDRPMCV